MPHKFLLKNGGMEIGITITKKKKKNQQKREEKQVNYLLSVFPIFWHLLVHFCHQSTIIVDFVTFFWFCLL